MKKQNTESGPTPPTPTHKRVTRQSNESAMPVVEQAFALSPEAQNRILKARAQVLAQEPESETNTEHIEVVAFNLAYETYGIETAYVREVYPLKDLTPLPCTPSFVIGIVNVRGQVLSVIDIKKFFELPEQGLTDLNKVIIISDGDMEFGILADAIVDVRNVPLREIQPSLPTLTGIREAYLMGIATERLVMLDAAKLLADNSILVHEEVM